MKRSILNKAITISTAILLSFQAVFFVFEPISLDAATATDDIVVTLNVDSGLILSDGANVTMSPNLGISGNQSIGGSSWIAKTNSSTGYTLAVKASTNPALKSSTNSFADYTETSTGTPETWSVSSGNYEFGYSVNGTDVDGGTSKWGTATDCGTGGVPNANGKYMGMTTSDNTVASRSVVTPVAGIQTNICFAAEQKDVYAPSGSYTATITATMTAS